MTEASNTIVVQSSVPIIGIVGGVGSGKSTLARWVAEHHPAVVMDADRIGHALLGDAAVKTALRAEFGGDIFDTDGNVIRSSLAQKVFGTSPEQQAGRQRLDALLHPLIRQEIHRHVASVDPQRIRVVLLDAALLLESGWRDQCRAVVFIDTPLERREQWVRTNRGWTVEELQRREASQWPLERKRAAADVVIPNDGDVATAAADLWNGIQRVL
ncbi:MAG TPA: dephospho-CoA kinase [Planctomycetaceae bacterium]|jgi:dephospho-CoA kinase|nr:dephospho-CoA kinase [Planctomycetaceae bacterium]